MEAGSGPAREPRVALFLEEDGTPMMFYMINIQSNSKYGEDRARIQALVERHGGRWTPPRDAKEKGYLHRLVRPEDKDTWQKRLIPDQVLYLTTYVDTCVAHNKLVPLAPFTVRACEARPKRRHSYFSEEDDAALIEHAQKANSSLKGNRFWTKVADEWGRGHTWQSLKNRYKRHILPALEAGKKFKTAETLEDDNIDNRKGKCHGPLKELRTNDAELPLQRASTMTETELKVLKRCPTKRGSAAVTNIKQLRKVGKKPRKLSVRHLSEDLSGEKCYLQDELTCQENKAFLDTKDKLACKIGQNVILKQEDEAVLEREPLGPAVLNEFGESSVSADEAPLGEIGKRHARKFKNVSTPNEKQSADCVVNAQQYRRRRKEASDVQMQADMIVEETLGQNAWQGKDDKDFEEGAAEMKLTNRQLTRIEQVRRGVRSLQILTGSTEAEVLKALVTSSGNFIAAESLLKEWKAGSKNEIGPVWSTDEDLVLLRYSTSGQRDKLEDVAKLREGRGLAAVEARIFFLTGGLQEPGEE